MHIEEMEVDSFSGEEMKTPIVKPIAIKPTDQTPNTSFSAPNGAAAAAAGALGGWNPFTSPVMSGNVGLPTPFAAGLFHPTPAGFMMQNPVGGSATDFANFAGSTPMLAGAMGNQFRFGGQLPIASALLSAQSPVGMGMFGQTPTLNVGNSANGLTSTPSLFGPSPQRGFSAFLQPANSNSNSNQGLPPLDGLLGPSATPTGYGLHNMYQKMIEERKSKFSNFENVSNIHAEVAESTSPTSHQETSQKVSSVLSNHCHLFEDVSKFFLAELEHLPDADSMPPPLIPSALEVNGSQGFSMQIPPFNHASPAGSDGSGDNGTSHPQGGISKKSGGGKKSGKTGTSCHQCKSRQDKSALSYCMNQKTNLPENSNRPCRKKYCDGCLNKFYFEKPPADRHTTSK
jgi:hypothetical protein